MKKERIETESSNGNMNRNIKGINQFLSSKKGAAFFIAMFLIMLIILVFGGEDLGGFKESKKDDTEKRLAKILSEAEGIEKAEVMITYENKNTQSKSVSGDIYSFNLSKNSQSDETDSVREIRGVVVAIKGADDYSVRISAINMVKTALDVPANKIEVVKMK